MLGFLVVVVHREVGDVGKILSVHRPVDVAGRHARRTPQPAGIGVGALVVQAQQQGVAQGPGLEVGLEVVIHRELAGVLIDLACGALDGAIVADGFIRARRPDLPARGDALKFQIILGVAQVLAELPGVIEAVLEGVTQGVIGAVVEFPVRIAKVLVMGNLSGGRTQFCALQRQKLPGDTGVVAGVLGQQGQPGVVVDVPGQAGCQVVAAARSGARRDGWS